MKKLRLPALAGAILFFTFSSASAASNCKAGFEIKRDGSYTPVKKSKSGDCVKCKTSQNQDTIKANTIEHSEEVLTKAYEISGMCCTSFTFAEGMTCRGRMGKYPKDVVVFIPPKYKPSEKIDVILHLHGYLLGEDFDPTVLGRNQFQKMLKDMNRNSILVVPESDDKNSTHIAEFFPDWKQKPASRFPAFMDALDSKLNHLGKNGKGSIGSMTLSGHSGAIFPIEGILQQDKDPWFSKIEKLALFDATYRPIVGDYDYPGLIGFIRNHSEKFTSVFLTPGDTANGSMYLEGEYCASRPYTAGLKGQEQQKEIEKCRTRVESSPMPIDPKFVKIDRNDPRVNKKGLDIPHFQVMYVEFVNQLKK